MAFGPNGAGKTTAIRCILGLIRKDAGNVTIFGETNPVRQRAHVGAMVETPRFFDWMSARGNLERAAAFAGQGDRSDIDRALQLVGLWGRESEPVRAFSLGMRQRLGIARALVGRPKLLVLDEPTNGLDPRGMKEVRDLLDNLAKSTQLTILHQLSHLLDEIEKLCDRVGIIEHGRMIAEGKVTELVAGEGGVTAVGVGATDHAALLSALEKMSDVTLDGDGLGGRLRVLLSDVEPSALNARLCGCWRIGHRARSAGAEPRAALSCLSPARRSPDASTHVGDDSGRDHGRLRSVVWPWGTGGGP